MNKDRLFLFDIDGVLLKGETAALHPRSSFAVNKIFGSKVSMSMVPTSGKTDKAILIELALLAGVKRAVAEKHMAKLYRISKLYVKNNMNRYPAHVFGGVRRLLDMLKSEGYILGLVTGGNLKSNAKMKLEKAKLYNNFKVKAFGDQFVSRVDIIKDALKRARKYGLRLDRKNVFYFGDSPLDVIAGKKAGVKVVAVATGKYTIARLSREKPTIVLKDLRNLARISKMLKIDL